MIVATELTNQAADTPHLPGLLEATIASARTPARFLADAGYWSETNHQHLIDAEIDGYIATGRFRHNEPAPPAPRGPIPKDATPKHGWPASFAPRRVRPSAEDVPLVVERQRRSPQLHDVISL